MESISSFAGNDAPVKDELDVKDLNVIGHIPNDLAGIYMRNGPNSFFQSDFMFDGDGMIHAVYLANGKAHYRNCYINTKDLQRERRAGKALFSSILNPQPIDPEWAEAGDGVVARKNSASMNIIPHQNNFLALFEGHPPYEMTRQLVTLGEWKPCNSKHFLSVCAHTRRDPKTEDLWFVKYNLTAPFLTLYCVNQENQLIKEIPIEKNYSSMVHDFILTENYIIVFDCPVTFDFERLFSGKSLIHWQQNLGVRIIIISRDGKKIKSFNTHAFFVFHFANAYENEDEIIIDYVQHEHGDLFSGASINRPSSYLYRTRLTLNDSKIQHAQLDNRVVEFPCINENISTKNHQYIYAITSVFCQNSQQESNAIIKMDVQNKLSYLYQFDDQVQLSEPIFVSRNNSKLEDDGYLILFVFYFYSRHSELVILDAKDFTIEPLARVQMPRRIPRGFHGSWKAE